MTAALGGEPPPLQAVIFDWGGTLTPWHAVDLEEQWRVFARQVHTEEERAGELAARILEAESAAWGRGRTDHSSARLREILSAAGLDEGDVRRLAAQTAYEKFWEPHTFTDKQVRPLWEGLRERGLRVGVLSNTIWTGDYHRAIFERDGVAELIDGAVYSSEIEHVKPHPEAFRAAAARVGVAPEAAVYVGDRIYEDVHGPQQVGMRAIWIPHSDIPAAQRVAVRAEPDAVARELIDILHIVDAWAAGG